MRLNLTEDQRYIEFRPADAVERNLLDNFPAFIRKAGRRLLPAKPHVVQSVISRLKKIYKKPINVDQKEIVDMVRSSLKLKEIPSDFTYFTNPLEHQEIALRYLYTVGSAGLLLDPGLGKTKVILDFIALMKFAKSLIVCPKALLFVWEDEQKKHRPDKSIYVIESTSWGERIQGAQKRKIKWEEEMLACEECSDEYKRARINFNKACKDLEELPKAAAADLERAKAADIVVVNYDKVANGLDYFKRHFKFDFMALDEGLIKSHDSKRTIAVTDLGNKTPYRCVMSGTLINNTALDAYSPIRFIEPALVGTGHGRFVNKYAKRIELKDGRSFIAGISKDNIEEIRTILESCSIVMRKEEWLKNLPGKTFNVITSEMTQEQKDVLEPLVSTYITRFQEKEVAVENPLSLMAKVSQITNGFLYVYDEVKDEDDYLADLFGLQDDDKPKRKGPRETLYFGQQPKLQSLVDLVTGPLRQRKAIVWYNCTAEFDLLSQTFKRLGIKFLSIRGGSKTTGEVVRTFNQSDEYQFLICQAKAVNYGITVLGKNPEALEGDIDGLMPEIDTRVYTHIFYSLNYSLEVFLQQQDRSHRIGQTMPVDYYILLSDCYADQAIYNALSTKMEVREATLIDISRRLKELV